MFFIKCLHQFLNLAIDSSTLHDKIWFIIEYQISPLNYLGHFFCTTECINICFVVFFPFFFNYSQLVELCCCFFGGEGNLTARDDGRVKVTNARLDLHASRNL